MVKEEVDMEYISLHGYIRNTSSDTEVHAELQLRAERSTWPEEKNMLLLLLLLLSRFSRVRLFATPWIAARQASLSTHSWCSVCTSVSEDVFLMYPWREKCSMPTYSSAIFFCIWLFKGFLFLTCGQQRTTHDAMESVWVSCRIRGSNNLGAKPVVNSSRSRRPTVSRYYPLSLFHDPSEILITAVMNTW